MQIQDRPIGPGHPTYVIAELSANHANDFDHACNVIRAMKESGADAVKVQTYTADTMTIPSRKPHFLVGGGTLWDGRTLHDLYQEASTPWEWQPKLQALAHSLGMHFFSTPFDPTSVTFLEAMNVPVHKIASFEIVDIPLLKCVAATGKPVIVSTGMSTLEEIDEAVRTLKEHGSGPIALLKCTSAYPATADEMHLATIADMRARFACPIGLSDHTPGHVVAVAAVAMGACLVEKHFTLSRSIPGPDSSFSMEPAEFRTMVDAIRIVEKAVGSVSYKVCASEEKSLVFRKSLFVVQDVREGEVIDATHVRAIRPGYGLHTRHLDEVIGQRAKRDIEAGTPFEWSMIR